MVTKTTGESGRNVPVPRRCMSNGSTAAAARGEVLVDRLEAVASSSIGGSSVTCVGICAAVTSPMDVR